MCCSAFLILKAFMSRGSQVGGKQITSKGFGNVPYLQDAGETQEVSDGGDDYILSENEPKLCVTSEAGCWQGH